MMNGFNTIPNGPEKGFRVALFGPQVTTWTTDSLSSLQLALTKDSNLKFLRQTLASISSIWPLLEKEFGQHGFPGVKKLEGLESFSTGDNALDPQTLTNIELAPLTIVSHVVEFIQQTDSLVRQHDLKSFEAAQGFCIGFLSAAALASASNWDEFESNVSNAVRLATCVGVVVDAQDLSLEAQDRTIAVSVRWKKAADRELLETCLSRFPRAYISCITDEKTLTITLPESRQAEFCARMSEAKLATTKVGLHGSYHHPSNIKAAETLTRICADNGKLLGLPDAQRLRLPLRSTADARLINTGALHDIALQLILCERANWFQTIKLTIGDIHYDTTITFVPLPRKPSCVPRSLKHATSSAGLDSDLHVDAKGLEEIAVVGMGCRYPRAENLEAFWELLQKGETAIGKVPSERFSTAHLTRGPKLADFWGNFLDRADAFDHQFFSVSGREAKSLDPQQRLALQVAYEALESSNYFCGTAAAALEKDVGCYLGVGSVDYEDNIASQDATAFSAVGTLRAFISGRISHFFGWSGPSLTFDTACSSSAVAIHTACKALLGNECSMALAGGVNVITSPKLYQNLASASFLNPNGSSKAFDAAANGYCRGEGAGILVLKKLSKALADGDTVLGVISASAVNQGSNQSSITVPDAGSQSSLYRRVLSDAQILEPKDVGYVEAHGTGTPVGDPIEYESVRQVLTGCGRDDNLFLGSVKDNIGHTEAASGAAGIIKVLLMMQHRKIPKQANFVTLNPSIKASPEIIVSKTTRPWTSRRLVALVNNYGAAGSNAALVLRSHPDTSSSSTVKSEGMLSSTATYPILLSAKTSNALQAYINVLKSSLHKVEASFASIAYKISRSHNVSFEHRMGFVAADAESAISTLESSMATVTKTGTRKADLPIVLCFGGQTGQNVKASKELYDSCQLFRDHLDKCDAVCRSLGLPSIFPGIFQDHDVQDLVSLHCMLLSVQVSSAKCWIDCGLKVDTLIGHSFGQLAALCIADSISLEDTFRLVSGRARLIRDNWGPDSGSMLSVDCDKGEIEAIVRAVISIEGNPRIDIACYNGPRSFVLAGDSSSIEKAREECTRRSLKITMLQNTHAYHSYLADVMLGDLSILAESITIRPPQLRVETCSPNSSWSRYTSQEVAQHTREPVYFDEAVERIAARLPSAVWLESGSATPIVAMTRRIITSKSGRSDAFIPMDLGTKDATMVLAKSVCQLWKAGSLAQYWLFHPSSSSRYQTVNLPPYQFENKSHWIHLKTQNQSEEPKANGAGLQTMLDKISGTASGELLFSVDISNIAFELATRGHAVTDRSLCPASMYIEIAALATKSLVGAATQTTGALPHVEGLIMSAPLGLGGGVSVFLHLRHTAQDAWDFTIFSRTKLSANTQNGEADVEHAKGRIDWGTMGDTSTNGRWKLLERLSTQGAKRLSSLETSGVSGTMVYKIFSNVVAYAPYYHGVQNVSASENEAVGLVKVPMQRPPPLGKDDNSVCDPIILDNFLQVAGIHVNCLSHRGNDEVFICTSVDEVIFTAPFMTDRDDTRVWSVYTCYQSVSKGEIANDIFVSDTNTGTLVLAILGASFKSVLFKSLARSLARLNKGAETKIITDVLPEDSGMEDSAYQTGSSPSPRGEGDAKLAKLNFEITDQPVDMPKPKSGDLLQMIREMFSSINEIPVEEIEPTSTLEELGVDSLLVTDILSEVHSRFNVSVTQQQFMSCSDLLSVVQLIGPDQPSPVKSIKKQQTLNGVAGKESQGPLQEKLTNGFKPDFILQKPSDQAGYNLAAASHLSFDAAKPSYDSHAETTGFAEFYSQVFPLQSELVVRYVVEAFASLGCNLKTLKPGDEVSMITFDPKHRKLIPQLYKLLQDGRLLTKGEDGVLRRSKLPIPMVPAATLHEEMLAKFPKHTSETRLLHTTGQRLADCLSGIADPIALIFQSSAARALLEDVYTNAPMFKTGTLLLGQYLSSVLESLGGSRELRILELGAGTGGTSKHIIETLATLGDHHTFSYTFTDLSSSLVVAAKRKFAKWPFMKYMVLDIEKEPTQQLLGNYDVILSTNCIHATRNLVHSLGNMRKMLRPDGIVALVELTRNLYWFDLVFGLLEGWWLFNDGREHALADEQRWDRSFRTAGFEWVDWSSSPSPESEILRVITASPHKLPTVGVDSALVTRTEDHDLVTKQTMTFKEVDGLQLKLDIYFPPAEVDRSKRLPIALMIHGGGHIMLSRNDIRPEQTNLLIRNGFLPISIDYRLCPETTLLEGPMTDVADALAWVRNTLPITALARLDVVPDADRVVAVGWSTGGHLAMTLAWTSPRLHVQPPSAILAFYCPTDYEDLFWTTPNVPAGVQISANGSGVASDSYLLDDEIWDQGVFDTPVTAYNVPPRKGRAAGGWLATSDARSRLAVHMNVHGRTLHVLLGGLDKRTQEQPGVPSPADVTEASPLAQIREGKYKTPTFIVHPRQDDLIPWQQAERTFKALRDRGVKAELRIVEGVPHLFDIDPQHQGYGAAMEALADGYEFLCRQGGVQWRG